jgi:hypothetical protein
VERLPAGKPLIHCRFFPRIEPGIGIAKYDHPDIVIIQGIEPPEQAHPRGGLVHLDDFDVAELRQFIKDRRRHIVGYIETANPTGIYLRCKLRVLNCAHGVHGHRAPQTERDDLFFLTQNNEALY